MSDVDISCGIKEIILQILKAHLIEYDVSNLGGIGGEYFIEMSNEWYLLLDLGLSFAHLNSPEYIEIYHINDENNNLFRIGYVINNDFAIDIFSLESTIPYPIIRNFLDDIKKKKYTVTITETLSKNISIYESSPDEAIKVIKEGWEASKYILDADCFNEVNFEIV